MKRKLSVIISYFPVVYLIAKPDKKVISFIQTENIKKIKPVAIYTIKDPGL